ncbi:MAG TPA: formyl-CoA transferase [Desulfotomaculum sp.]|nr:formyl-CoA transferase [Desulfotomaculum sp.]
MQPLEGIKVLDFTQAAGGPFGGMILGDMGAEVIKVEPPSGDHFRPTMGGAWSVVVNRNKRGLAIDLRTPEAKEVIFRLVKEADVFMEAFVPGVMERLGFNYEQVSKINPKIIYCSISGYGQSGPYKKRPGYDICAQAESGLMAATGEPDRPPVRIASSLIDYGTGMYGVIGILMALMVREKTGKGQYIDVSLFDTAVSWMNYWITFCSITGQNPPRVGSGHLLGAPYQVFNTKDDPLFIGVSTEKMWKEFCRLLNLSHLYDDPRFVKNADRTKNRADLISLVQEILSKYGSVELKEMMDSVGIPCARVMTVSQVIEDPHVGERGVVVELNDPVLGKVKVPGIALRLSDTPGQIKTSTPRIGEHSTDILKEAGFGEEEIENLINKKVIFQYGR